ncbi:Uncharacterised protein [Mycobacteroides abscessus subsp. abscessus]|nr:Uncharacterised protein [Mycobacteroides abscessus subsp. abscessus]
MMAAGPGAAAWLIADSGIPVLLCTVNGFGALAVGDGLAACGLGLRCCADDVTLGCWAAICMSAASI